MSKEKPMTPMEKFMDFYDRIKGRKDVKTRVSVLANPENLKTMSILTRSEAEFVSEAYWVSGVSKWGAMFKGLEKLAKEKLETNISIGGEGREQAIRFMGALSETKFLSKLGVDISGQPREGTSKK